MADQEYELFAIRYATSDARRSDHFIGGDPHDGPMPMDYFMWVARGGGRTFVIDTGFNAEVANKRKRTFLRCPVETLGAFDIDAAGVEDVILTHLHYDHVGNFDRFPNARFHLQEREIAYATGRFMRYPRLSHSFEVEDVCGIVRLNYAHRVPFAVWRALAWASEILPDPLLTRNQVELMEIDTVSSPEMAGFVELGISPRSVEAMLQEMLPKYG